MSDNIPFEIQMDIIKRLPVKSVVQFRSVSKSWKSVIDSSQFIADYNVCQYRPQHLLINCKDDSYTKFTMRSDTEYLCIVDDDVFPHHNFATTCPLFTEHLDELTLVGSSQGLFCLLASYGDNNASDREMEIAFIWNPAIKKSIAVDVPVSESHGAFSNILGFGVCPSTNEPMLVLVNEDDELCWPIAVFTLSSRVWRRPRGNFPRKSVGFDWSQVVIDGFIYWLTNYWLVVITFDMTSEEFAEINPPLSLRYSDVSITKLRESLALLQYDIEAKKMVCAVWVMEHGDSKSFTKLYTVTDPNAALKKVLGFRKNGEAILVVRTSDYKDFLEVYDPHSDLIKDLEICGASDWFPVCSYRETLLLLDQADNQHIKIKFQNL